MLVAHILRYMLILTADLAQSNLSQSFCLHMPLGNGTGWGGHGSGCESRRWTPMTRSDPSLKSTVTLTTKSTDHQHNHGGNKRGTRAGVQGTSAIFYFFSFFLTDI